ncbi:CASP-like protein 4D1 [Vitis vinifera]|uniref:CASP-like protein n=1 Tax=Vitis vinifera TaxID=29760 RepID=A0A438DGK9_VITVI|nr:CASP-like protein 4D1 [Vitis vinifera]
MPQSSGSKALAITSLVVRLLTLIFLLASLIVIATESATMKIDFTEVKIRFKNVYSYRYMVSVTVIGLAYTFLQIPFAVHYACTGKRLGAHDGLLKFEFFGDKVISYLLATGVGAAFGATFDLKKNLDDLERLVRRMNIYGSALLFSEIRSKLDDFFNLAYVSAGLLLLGFLCFGVSSIISSLALSK